MVALVSFDSENRNEHVHPDMLIVHFVWGRETDQSDQLYPHPNDAPNHFHRTRRIVLIWEVLQSFMTKLIILARRTRRGKGFFQFQISTIHFLVYWITRTYILRIGPSTRLSVAQKFGDPFFCSVNHPLVNRLMMCESGWKLPSSVCFRVSRRDGYIKIFNLRELVQEDSARPAAGFGHAYLKGPRFDNLRHHKHCQNTLTVYNHHTIEYRTRKILGHIGSTASNASDSMILVIWNFFKPDPIQKRKGRWKRADS